ncbi:hypothetical protein HZS_7847 [Henneguya salminicola]|nr:hypothetical protein HZS_7847 [Henneguya salminicola]
MMEKSTQSCNMCFWNVEKGIFYGCKFRFRKNHRIQKQFL